MISVHVCRGDEVVDICRNEASLGRYIRAANVDVERSRRGRVVKIHLDPDAVLVDESGKKSLHQNSRVATYEEDGLAARLVTLKRIHPKTGGLVRWDDDDSFTPGRFNPDRPPQPILSSADARAFEPPVRRAVNNRPAKPSHAPTVPPARFYVRRDRSLPWSEANSLPVF